jgi:hypothetical protein
MSKDMLISITVKRVSRAPFHVFFHTVEVAGGGGGFGVDGRHFITNS